MGYKRLRPRPWPLKQDDDLRKQFKEDIAKQKNCSEVEIWYQDESGIMGDSRPRSILAKKGSRPKIHFTGAHIKTNVIGAVKPIEGTFISLIMPEMNAITFQIFLDEMQQYISSNKKVIMIMDNAAWHKAKELKWGRIEPMYLPPYSPDYNCIERIWLNMKESFFKTFVAAIYDELEDKLMTALKYYHNNPKVCKSICGG